ncbi:hypothetical protein I553_5888 [Mycobacterium xenopi 4042]|uniref:Uncharacterized protein n=1 Tax=Mycobacterium xenopi 4042 TaxID=1299334 RepID=X8BDU1_MYCXE|nr:hypothetical protein I553_5888 [Mycobacterium xenopi 4042]
MEPHTRPMASSSRRPSGSCWWLPTVLRRRCRLTNGYHANMMAAVAWLYAVMRGGRWAARSPTRPHNAQLARNEDAGMDISVPTQPNPGGSLPSTGSRRSDSQVPQCIGCITISPSGKRTLRSTPRSSGTGNAMPGIMASGMAIMSA